MLAFCGADGSLLDVPQPTATESWRDIQPVLRPFLTELLEVRLACGYTIAEAIPVFHAMDVFHKHEKMLQRLYADVFSAVRLTVESDTPRGDARRRLALPQEHTEGVCLVTGEPFHDIINMRKLISPRCNDAPDFVRDYSELIERLSFPAAPPRDVIGRAGGPPALSPSAVTLLSRGVKESSRLFKTSQAACPAASLEL